ncbi:MAG: glycosyltransferase [Actinomycetota bacterium]
MKLSVVIAAHNEETLLPAQLAALQAQTHDGDWDVIVADNRSTDATARIVTDLAAEWPRLRLVAAMERAERSYAWNTALAASDADAFVFTDADDIVAPGWVAAAAAGLSDASMITGPLDLDTLNPPELAASRGLSMRKPVGHFEGLFPVVYGNNFGMTREALDQVGPFTEGAFPVDDMEVSLRAHRAGIAIVGCPDLVVQYRYRSDLGSLWRQGFGYGRGRCRLARSLIDAGEPRPPRVAGWKSWLRLVAATPSVVTAGGRARWVWILANRLGQVRGSFENRLLYV